MDRVRVLLASLMLRRQKDAKVDGEPISKIPPKHTAVDNVEFSEEERGLYHALEAKSQDQMRMYIKENAIAGEFTFYPMLSVSLITSRKLRKCLSPLATTATGLLPSTADHGS